MAPRPYWTGSIRMSLVVIPVQIYSAIDAKSSVAFHQIHKPTGKRVRYQRVVPGEGEVDYEDIAKGYEISKGHYVVIDPKELKRLKLESNRTLNIVQFVAAEEIDPVYFDLPYFVLPDGDAAQEPFAVMRDALRESGKVGLGQIVVGGRERFGALRPSGKGLILEILRYSDELKDQDDFFDDIGDVEADEDQIALAQQLIERKTGKFDPDQFKDHYERAVRELIRRKMKGQKIVADEPEPKSAPVIDFMEALRKSLTSKADEKPRRSSRRTTAARKKTTRAGGAKAKKARAKPRVVKATKTKSRSKKPAASSRKTAAKAKAKRPTVRRAAGKRA
jgi:DNA end-binding protein Ku